MAVRGLVVEVCDLQGEQERGQDRSLRDPCTADYCVRHVVPSPHILWPVSEVIQEPGREVLVHPCQLQLVPQECRLYSVESTGEIKEHDPHSASRLLQVRQWSVQEEDDGVVHSDAQSNWSGSIKGPCRGRRWTRTSRSRVFIRCEVRATGLELLKSVGWGIFGAGNMQEVFHSSGTFPSFRLLKMYSTILHSWSTQDATCVCGPPAWFLPNNSYMAIEHKWYKSVKTNLNRNSVKEFILRDVHVTSSVICVLTIVDGWQTNYWIKVCVKSMLNLSWMCRCCSVILREFTCHLVTAAIVCFGFYYYKGRGETASLQSSSIRWWCGTLTCKQ